MANTSDVINAIIAQRDLAENKLTAAYGQLNATKVSIAMGASGRDLNSKEIAKVAILDAGMKAITRADTQLQLATVTLLNGSADAKKFADKLDAINETLKNQRSDIESVSSAITKMDSVVKTIDSVVQGVLHLLAIVG